MEVVGLTEEALNYIYKHSQFKQYDGSIEPIGCGYSDGVASVVANMYEVKEITEDQKIFLFEYQIDNGTVKEVLQDIKNDKIFLCLKINNRRKFKWNLKDD